MNLALFWVIDASLQIYTSRSQAITAKTEVCWFMTSAPSVRSLPATKHLNYGRRRPWDVNISFYHGCKQPYTHTNVHTDSAYTHSQTHVCSLRTWLIFTGGLGEAEPTGAWRYNAGQSKPCSHIYTHYLFIHINIWLFPLIIILFLNLETCSLISSFKFQPPILLNII